MKKLLSLICILIVIVFLIVMFNDGWILYNVQKKVLSPLEIINYYTSIQLPSSSRVESIEFGEESTDENEEYFIATVLVPSDEIDKLFKEEIRDYDVRHARIVNFDKIEKVWFSSLMFQVVRKWNTKTQRNIQFIVLKPDGEYTEMHIFVDRLGWYLWDKWKLGGLEKDLWG